MGNGARSSDFREGPRAHPGLFTRGAGSPSISCCGVEGCSQDRPLPGLYLPQTLEGLAPKATESSRRWCDRQWCVEAPTTCAVFLLLTSVILGI